MSENKTLNYNLKKLSLLFSLCLFTFSSVGFTYAQEKFLYEAKGKRNPFIPLVTSDGRLLSLDKEEEKGNEDLLIEGIIYDKHGRSFAIVNGSVLGVGDSAGNYQVLRIEENKVVFIKEGQIKEVITEKEVK